MVRRELMSKLEHQKRLVTPAVRRAFARVDRAKFVPPEWEDLAYEDGPLPIGYGQSISQPSTVATMLELLAVEPGQSILDVGAGSGWTTALLADMVGETGRVRGVERIPELVTYGRHNLLQFDYDWASIELAREPLGLAGLGGFHRILVSAATRAVPEALVAQLLLDGILVIPVHDCLYRVHKLSHEKLRQEIYYGYRFVPLVA